jgi:hypothetical protein
MAKGLEMRHYIALIRKEYGPSCGVSFSHLPGIVMVGASIDEARRPLKCSNLDTISRGCARSMSGADPAFRNDASDAVVAAIPRLTKPKPQNRPQASPVFERP